MFWWTWLTAIIGLVYDPKMHKVAIWGTECCRKSPEVTQNDLKWPKIENWGEGRALSKINYIFVLNIQLENFFHAGYVGEVMYFGRFFYLSIFLDWNLIFFKKIQKIIIQATMQLFSSRNNNRLRCQPSVIECSRSDSLDKTQW